VDPTCSVTPYTVPFDGKSHTATGSCLAVDGTTALGGLLLSGTTHTNAGTYADSWKFTDSTGNYNDVPATLVTDTIKKVTLTVTPDPQSMILGGAVPAFTFQATGFVSPDSWLTGMQPTCSAGAGPFTVVGSPYSITCVGGDAGSNYTVNDTATAKLTVSYEPSGTSCDGDAGHQILQPVNNDGTSVFKQGSTVPAKFRVCDAKGNSIGTLGVVSSFRLVQTINGTVVQNVDESVDSTTPDTAFRFDPTGQQWIYNMSTKSLSKNNTYVYQITLNDGSTIKFQFGLK
jgi:hypothetical protein